MNMLAWPFLVGRNKNLTHQTIVSPSFLNEQGMSILLAEAAGGPENGPSDAYYREIHGKGSTVLSIIFRVTRARAQNYGLGGSEYLKDKLGRPILLIEGFAVPGRLGSMKDGGSIFEALQAAHASVERIYHNFWAEDYSFPAQSSSPFELPSENYSSRPVELKMQEPFKLNDRLPEPFAITGSTSTDQSGFTIFDYIKSRAFVLMLCAVLLIVGGITIYLIIPRPVPPSLTQTVQNFCNGLQSSEYSEAISQIKTGSNVHVPTQKDFTNFFPKSGAHHVTCASNISGPSDATDNTILTLTFPDKTLEQLKLELMEVSGGSWKIDKITCAEDSRDPFC